MKTAILEKLGNVRGLVRGIDVRRMVREPETVIATVADINKALDAIGVVVKDLASHSDEQHQRHRTRVVHQRRALREANRKIESFRLFIQARSSGSISFSSLATSEVHHRNNELQRKLLAVTKQRDDAQSYIEQLKAAARGEGEAPKAAE